MKFTNREINRLRKQRDRQELLLSLESKKQYIDEELTKKAEDYIRTRKVTISVLDIKKLLLQALLNRIDISDKIAAYQLQEEYISQS